MLRVDEDEFAPRAAARGRPRPARPARREQRARVPRGRRPRVPAARPRRPGCALRQVLINLVGNAVKFTERGEVVVRATPGELRVSDTGIGIAPERPAAAVRAVLPGRREHHPPLRRHRPRALDLAPARRADGRTARRLQHARRGQHVRRLAGAARPRARASRRTLPVLVGEDNPVNQLVAGEMLRKQGYAVELAPRRPAGARHGGRAPLRGGLHGLRDARARRLRGDRRAAPARVRVPIIAMTMRRRPRGLPGRRDGRPPAQAAARRRRRGHARPLALGQTAPGMTVWFRRR